MDPSRSKPRLLIADADPETIGVLKKILVSNYDLKVTTQGEEVIGLASDADAPGHLYAGLANGDVWHTQNYGDSWNKLPFNLGGIHHSMIMI